MKKRRPKIVAGFNAVLEHLLPYEKEEEKGSMSASPTVQLGGGAFNILKTLHALGVREQDTMLIAFTNAVPSAQGKSLSFLLEREQFPCVSLPVLSRLLSSYYLFPRRGGAFAFGDGPVSISELSGRERKALERASYSADLKIVAEPNASLRAVQTAIVLMRQHRNNQYSVLIPSYELLVSSYLKQLLPHISLLSCNRAEAKLLFGRITDEALMKYPVPNILVTDGPRLALLKSAGRIIRQKPKPLLRPLYVGGAGDATTATLSYELFVKKTAPEVALRKALTVGRKVVSLKTPYLSSHT